jgi:membrane fusion protein, multidrug efflux system
MNYLNSLISSLCSLAVASTLTIGCGKPPQPPGGGGPQGKPRVSFINLEPRSVTLTTELPGRITPALIAEVRPQVTGIVKSRRFDEGAEVKAGQVLYQIDPATYLANVQSAQATLAKAEANRVAVRLKAERMQALAAIKAVSQQDADDASALLLQSEADILSSRAALQTQRINLDYTRVVAPIDGRIGRSSVTQGALVTANQPSALATVQKLDPIYVDVTQSSAALAASSRALATGEMKVGTTRVQLLLEDGTPYPLPGILRFAEVSVLESTGSVTLRAEFPNPSGVLLPGMYVRAVVEEGSLDEALLVPQVAVNRDATGRAQVRVVDAEEKIAERSITTARALGAEWLVTSGIAAGERVVIEGGQKAPPGTQVEATPFTRPAKLTTASANDPASANHPASVGL